MDVVAVTVLICVAAFAIIYINGRYYLNEGFDPINWKEEEKKGKQMARDHALSVYNSVGVREDLSLDPPYATKPIMTIDDY